MTLTFSNPRLRAEFDDWPLGGSKRGRCVFEVVKDKRGWRTSRTTTGKPKWTTYSGQAAIVDGSDGKTYILQVAQGFGFIKVMRSDFLDASGDLGVPSAVFERDLELQAELLKLIVTAGSAFLQETV